MTETMGKAGMGDKMRPMNSWLRLAAVVLGILLFSLLLTAVDGSGSTWPGFGGYSLLLLLGLASFIWMRHLIAASQAVSKAALTAFFVRFFIGVALMLILPLAGYQDNPASKAGYVYKDSYGRDTQAWELAKSGEPLLTAFSGAYTGDQYGGMLVFSALIYRYLSPDAHRPFLILIMTAAVSIWGVLATWGVVKAWFGESAGLVAAWVMALYPESVLLGATHMREAFVIPAAALAWYGLVERSEGRRGIGWMVVVAALILLLVQPAAAMGIFLVLLIFWVGDPESQVSWKRVLLTGGLFLLALVLLYSIWANLPSLHHSKGWQVFSLWLENNFLFQAKITVRASGWLQNILGDLGEQWRGLVVMGYGLFQPVLPAALITPGAWIWRVLGSLRAAGWYMIIPFLLYSPWLVWRVKLEKRRRQLYWLVIAVWSWTLIASANAGGDQWDNPRYRAMFLVFQAVLTAWVWHALREYEDRIIEYRWFKRLVAVEGVFILLFTYWYIGRKYIKAIWLDIWVIVIIFLVLSAAIVFGGLWRDWKKSKVIATGNNHGVDTRDS